MPASRQVAKEELERYAVEFEQCVRAALREYVDLYGAVRHKHSKRSEASLIHDLMVAQFEGKFGALLDAPGGEIGMHKKGNLRQLIVDNGRYKMKLKKLDEKLLHRSIPTKAALRFVWQENLFAEVPDPTNLHIGYQATSEAALTEAKVWVTCPDGSNVGWSWELDQAQPATIDTRPAEVEPIAAERRVSLKPAIQAQLPKDEKKSAAEGDGGSDSQ